MAKPHSEKRSRQRVRTDDTIAVKVLNGAIKDAQAQLHDVSMRGVFLYLQNRVAEGSTLEMVLPLPQGIMPSQEDWIRCKCRVLRVENKGGTEYGVAALIEEFEPLDAAKFPQA